MAEVNFIGIDRWDRLRELIEIRKAKPFVVLFGSRNCNVSRHICENVLPKVGMTKDVSLFFVSIDGAETSIYDGIREGLGLGIEQYPPTVIIFRDGVILNNVVPDDDTNPEDILKFLA
jgi:hypothetical protein